ncbi:MAG: hypothetical protein IRY99_05045, partial [Isosphaeraceae bacterium]|nr:hypothetical protein [Isosphaeraceae bacterium]
MSEGLRPPSRLEPAAAWTVVTDSPLLGLALAREAGLLLAWDDGGQLYLLDGHGERRLATRAAGRVLWAAISDDGSLVAVVSEGPRLWLLDPEFEPLAERPSISEPSALAVDPHGRYVAVASRLGITQLYNRFGKQAGRVETMQPLSHLRFVPSRPLLLGASGYGSIVGIELGTTGSGGTLDPAVAWKQQLLSNVGRLATSGDGGMVLVSCFTHGVQRYDARGHNEGSYHLGGTVAHAVPDFAGRLIVVATAEGELALLNRAGNVRWKTALPRPAIALEVDALGRYFLYGLATGEITRLDLEAAPRPATAAPSAAAPTTTPAPA